MLLWAWLYGIGHDATYRHMNENRAPLTIMITLDTLGRMVPGNESSPSLSKSLAHFIPLIGFAHLASDTTVETQVVFLQEAKRLVEKMAADLVSGEELPFQYDQS